LSRIFVLDPTASPPKVDADPGPALAPALLDGGHFGIRYDPTWRSFEWVRDEWGRLLAEGGARVSDWCTGNRTGEAAQTTLAELEDFVRGQQVVIVGLGN
jgi:hypothetical protein